MPSQDEQQQQQIAPLRKEKTLKSMLSEEAFSKAVQAALPRHMSAERFIRVAITALTRTPKLQRCTPESFFKCLLDLSAIGLEPDGRHAHLIPFENRKSGTVECTLILDYKGIAQIVRRSGEVAYIHADVVYEGDDFDFTYGSGAFLRHKPNLNGERVKRKAVYSFVKMKDGSEDFLVWSFSQVEAIRKRSRAKDDGPWATGSTPGGDYDEMAKKSVFRNQSKWLPFSAEEVRKVLDSEADDMAVDIVDATFELPEGGSGEDVQKIAEAKRAALRQQIDAGAAAPAPEQQGQSTTEKHPLDEVLSYRARLRQEDFARITKAHMERHGVDQIGDLQDAQLKPMLYDLDSFLQDQQQGQQQLADAPAEDRPRRRALKGL